MIIPNHNDLFFVQFNQTNLADNQIRVLAESIIPNPTLANFVMD